MRAAFVGLRHANDELVDYDACERGGKRLDTHAFRLAHLGNRMARKRGIQCILHISQLIGGNVFRKLDRPVEYLAVVGNDDHEHATRRHGHERNLLHRRREQRRRDHNRKAIGQARQGGRCLLHEVVHLRCRIAHVIEHAARGIFAVFARKQIIDERPIARISRNAASGSVRRSEIALIFKH